jgi:hypothetical protein
VLMADAQGVASAADHLCNERIDPNSTLRARKKERLMAKNKTNKSARRYRDSLNGRFVTKKFAKKHRDTTVKESRRAA